MRLIDADELRREFIIGHDLVGAKYVDLAPTIEPNLVLNPDEIERGDVVEIGENIVVMHHDDYYDMFLKSELYDDIESCEDTISRKAVKEELRKPIWKMTNKGELIATINYLPSVAPSRPSGEWVERTHNTLIAQVNFAYCSECGQPIMHEHTRPLWSFCPNCGARMKGADDEGVR